MAGKLFPFDINDGYRLKHNVDIAAGLVNPLEWLNVLVLLRSHGDDGPRPNLTRWLKFLAQTYFAASRMVPSPIPIWQNRLYEEDAQRRRRASH
ncbi:hypothetical protein SBA3_210007 [Candidatus Sulfopaludibacter sp. SbA3]|nr:hypothetical protein SBA3_210007 [Candidatus Sulfopaludibacter sp. SbA3]